MEVGGGLNQTLLRCEGRTLPLCGAENMSLVVSVELLGFKSSCELLSILLVSILL